MTRDPRMATLSPTTVAGLPLTARRVIAVLAFAALTALGARIAVPLPGTPVPFTFQVVAVLLAGVLLGPRLGAASQAAYLAAGASGLPIFAAGGGVAYLLGPTGGYLLAFPA
ncbi:MAG: biotin transporter BioY, partial [Gemmatimonadota bacterium]